MLLLDMYVIDFYAGCMTWIYLRIQGLLSLLATHLDLLDKELIEKQEYYEKEMMK